MRFHTLKPNVWLVEILFITSLFLFSSNPNGRGNQVHGYLYETALENEYVIPILDEEDLEERVMSSDNVWLLQFYSSDRECAECYQYEEMMETVGKITKGVFNIGVIDVARDDGKQIAYKWEAKDIPQIWFVSDYNDHKPVKYKGKNHDIQDVLESLSKHMVETLQDRINRGGMGPDSQPGGSNAKTSRERQQKKNKRDRPSKVVTLTSSNFDEEVLQNTDVVAVAFAAPWCGHCKKLQREWEEAAGKLDGEGATLGWVDATVETELAERYSVQGFPTIFVFDGGNSAKTDADAKPYNSDRSASIIVQNLLRTIDASPHQGPVTIPELINQQQYNKYCTGSKGRICVLAALPHLLETGAAGRSKYLSILYETYRTSFRGSAFKFAWFEAGNLNYKFEEALELTFGFPAVVAVSIERQAYTVMTGAFNTKSISAYLNSITAGKRKIKPLKAPLPEFATVEEPWDGVSDGKPIEDEFSLEDIMGDDDDDDSSSNLDKEEQEAEEEDDGNFDESELEDIEDVSDQSIYDEL